MNNITIRGLFVTLLMTISSIVSAAHIINPEYDFGHEAIENEQASYSMNLNNGVTATAYLYPILQPLCMPT